MPSSGKSTVAKAIAEKLAFRHVDLDHMVEKKEGMPLIKVMEMKGAQYFRDMEYDFLKNIAIDEKVIISTPGSAIYHIPMMEWLKKNTVIIFLEEDFSVIEKRLAHTPKAISDLKEKGLRRIWEERIPSYQKYADNIVKTGGRSILDIADECINLVTK